jgi:SAM-dependent methyltransferase
MKTDDQNTSPRLQREAEFHDRAYANNIREAATKYYAVIRSSRDAYEKILLQNVSGKRVLEYGCGRGSYAFVLAAAGAFVTGIDISPVAIGQSASEAAEKNVSGRTQFFVMDAEKTSFDDSSFDLICGTGILHHLNLEKSYREIARILKPGGHAVFSEPLGHNPLINWYRNRTPEMRTPDEHPLLARDLRLAKTFFPKVDLQFYHLLDLAAVPLRNTRLFSPTLQIAVGLDRILMLLMPPLRLWAWTVTITLVK